MSHGEKSFYYQRLKSAGWEPEKHYRDYTTDELSAAHAYLVQQGALAPAVWDSEEDEPEPSVNPDPAFFGLGPETTEDDLEKVDPVATPAPAPAPSQRDLMAGRDTNEEVVRVDEEGRQWLQEEVLKPAFPKPRGRRVLRYNDPGVKKATAKDGDYTETFEVAGDPKNATPSEIKITLPSYQVGIYRDKRFPFKVVTYNGKSGFDRQEVEAYYGGAELVPPTAKRTYVENVLCYDMRSVIRAINEEYRALQLSGRV